MWFFFYFSYISCIFLALFFGLLQSFWSIFHISYHVYVIHQHLKLAETSRNIYIYIYLIKVNWLKFLVKSLSLSQSPLSQCLCHFHNKHNKHKVHGKLDDSRELSGKNLSYKSANTSEHLTSWSLTVLLTGNVNSLHIHIFLHFLFICVPIICLTCYLLCSDVPCFNWHVHGLSGTLISVSLECIICLLFSPYT